MSKNCPTCHRPNGEAARRCLYCGAELASTAAEESAPEVEELWPSTYAVVTTGAGGPPERARFEAATGRPAAWLELGLPLLVAVCTDPDEAKAMHEGLVAEGVPATVVSDQELGKLAALEARRAQWVDGGIEIYAADGHRVTMRLTDVLLLVTGVVADPESIDDTNKLRPRSMVGMFVPQAAGGGGGRLTVLDLYARGARPVRLIAERFDYSILGPERETLALDNFPRLLEVLKQRLPHARFDASFRLLDRAFDGGGPSRYAEARRLTIYGRRIFQAMLQSGQA